MERASHHGEGSREQEREVLAIALTGNCSSKKDTGLGDAELVQERAPVERKEILKLEVGLTPKGKVRSHAR